MSIASKTTKMTASERAEFDHLVRVAGGLPISFLSCRLLRHAWMPIVPDYEAPFGRPLAFQCDRCASKRYDFYDIRWGNIVYRKYAYADGYLLTEDETGSKVRIPLDAIRAAYGKAVM